MTPPPQQGSSLDADPPDDHTNDAPDQPERSSDADRSDFLAAVLDGIPGLVFVFDDDDHVIWGNRAARATPSGSTQPLRGRKAAELFRSSDVYIVREALGEVRRGDGPTTVDVALNVGDGEPISCTFTGRRLPSENSAPSGYVVGVTRRTAALDGRVRRLRRERSRLEALYSGLPSPVLHYEVQEGEARVRGGNEAFEDVFGLSEADILDQNVDPVITPDRLDQHAERLTRQAVEEGSVQAEVVRETAEGPRYFRLNSVLFSGGERSEGYAIYTDITEQKERERTLQEEQEALRTMYRITADRDAAFKEKVQQLIDLGREYLTLPYGFLTEITDGTQHIVQTSGTRPLFQPGESCPLSESYCRKTIQGESLLAVQDAPDEGWADDPAYEIFELGSYIGAQILVEGELYRTLCFAATEPRDESFTERERTFVELMTRWASYELE